MTYQHGIRVQEKQTSSTKPVRGTSGLQVIYGTAPINLAKSPQEAVNKPVLINSFEEAVEKLGYSEDYNSYTLCQSMYACFKAFNVSPVIFCNVLNPAKHKMELGKKSYTVTGKQVIVDEKGLLLSTITVSKGEAELAQGTDYIMAFNDEGHVVITLLAAGTAYTALEISVSGTKIDPGAVMERDIIGGYDAETGLETGLETIRRVYPMFNMVPSLIVAPGWSKNPAVAAVMDAKCTEINGCFSCECIVDIDTAKATKYVDVGGEKEKLGVSEHSILLWPMVAIGEKVLSYSAVYAAMVAYTDAKNDDVPNLSPSNYLINVTGAVLADGTEVVMDEVQANMLNGKGIVTIISGNGYRSWGNNTACYPEVTDPKDRWISSRRFFTWWGNMFILTYKSKVDSPSDYRLIESIVDSENIRGNSYVAQNKCAGARIEFSEEENPIESVLEGKLLFRQYLAPYTPAEDILNILEFDPNMIKTALGGEER